MCDLRRLHPPDTNVEHKCARASSMTVLPSGKIGDPKGRHPANATVIVGSITV